MSMSSNTLLVKLYLGRNYEIIIDKMGLMGSQLMSESIQFYNTVLSIQWKL